jgi:hypothetical protein
LRLTDDDRRQLAARAYRLGRQVLREIATIVAPDTLLRCPTPLQPKTKIRSGCFWTALHPSAFLIVC